MMATKTKINLVVHCGNPECIEYREPSRWTFEGLVSTCPKCGHRYTIVDATYEYFDFDSEE